VKVLLEKRREYNLENTLPLLHSISQAQKNHNPSLTAITNIYENNIKIKLDTTLTQPTKINKEV